MSLPSVMVRKKEQLAAQAEQAESPNKKVVVLPSLEQPNQNKPIEPTPISDLTDDEIKALSTGSQNDSVVVPESASIPESQKPVKTIDQLENDFKSIKGQYEISNRENRELRNDYISLKTEYDSLKVRLNELENKTAPKSEPENDNDLELTDEEKAAYGDSLPVIDKLLAKRDRQTQRDVIKPLREEIEHLKKNNQNVATQIAAVDEDSFLQQVKSRVKNFEQIVASQEWRDYGNQPISPFSTTTIGEVLRFDAHPKRDLERVVKIFDNFATKPINPVLAAYTAPSVSGASAPVADLEGKKPTLKFSERKRISEDFRKGRISLAKYQQYAALYEQAEKENRVDFNR